MDKVLGLIKSWYDTNWHRIYVCVHIDMQFMFYYYLFSTLTTTNCTTKVVNSTRYTTQNFSAQRNFLYIYYVLIRENQTFT